MLSVCRVCCAVNEWVQGGIPHAKHHRELMHWCIHLREIKLEKQVVNLIWEPANRQNCSNQCAHAQQAHTLLPFVAFKKGWGISNFEPQAQE